MELNRTVVFWFLKSTFTQIGLVFGTVRLFGESLVFGMKAIQEITIYTD